MEMKEKKISSEIIYSGKVVQLERDTVLCPNGKQAYREVIRHSGGAAILCVTSDEQVLMIEQFRYPYDEVIYEIPAGKLESGEDPIEAAYREFEEETGNRADEMQFLGKIYPSCGYTSEVIYLYLAKNITPTSTAFDEDEVIETKLIPLKEVQEMILDGRIKDAKTICAISYYLLQHKIK